ncbi:uncharacterized protein LOC143878177 [Tasmannia lanceolata]|uniref:uncharacterized protein LOC143878177 n=1 Tax=Tasmannia lanceolata TaxID=3420 RepID=UPI004064083E
MRLSTTESQTNQAHKSFHFNFIFVLSFLPPSVVSLSSIFNFSISSTHTHLFLFSEITHSVMADSRDTHIVEIPIDEENLQRKLSTINDLSVIQHHPLMEISQSPGHLLLLKLWQREEDLFGRRIAIKETRIDNIKRQVFQLCCFFFAFHALFFTILFTSSIQPTCRKWWIPSFLSLFTSIFIICFVQLKLFRYAKVLSQLQRERSDNRALVRCIQELRMKGESFDLSKEPQTARRMKSSSVEIKWTPLKWFSQNLVTICLVCFTGMVFPACKFILCG